MKKIFFILLWGLYAGATGATTLTVCPTCEWTQIQAAIDAAGDCDTVRILSGTYRQKQIVVNKPVVLLGENYPVLDGENETEVLTIRSDFVTVEGLEIRNVGTSYIEDRAGIRVEKARFFDLRNNRLFNTFFGIYIAHASDGTVIGNVIEGEAHEEMSSGNAIHLWYCKRLLIENNHVRRHRDGIYFEFVDNSLIRKNVSEDNLRYGLHFMFSNDDNYYDNEFRRNGAGVAVMFSRRINMWDNLFEYNWGKASYGLLLKEIYDADIRNNTFLKNTIGIYVESSTRIQYESNRFVRNGWGIKVSGGCLDNTITRNDFIANSFDLGFNASRNSNDFNGNYWSDYTGYDLDRDGIGDVPYRPVKLFNFVVNKTPEAMILLRSLFVDIINFSEKVSPVFTPENVVDTRPLMSAVSANVS
ncbi:MAG: nitrous oxide reductase family maturation protein NosD [Bacteroidetes bacterium]|nr:MAG: nitrous oxide reductase family maturation protein NosD [Bacteroidota bacterium]